MTSAPVALELPKEPQGKSSALPLGHTLRF